MMMPEPGTPPGWATVRRLSCALRHDEGVNRHLLTASLLLVALAAGCSSGKSGAPASATTSPATTAPATTAPATTAPATTTAPPATTTAPPATTVTSPSALQAEATSAAQGDIPDNQAFLVFHNTGGGYSIKYPEGWAQQGNGASVTIRDKNNIVRIVVTPGAAPTAAAVRKQVGTLAGAHLQSGPVPVSLGGGKGFQVVYTTESAPNAVTGKKVTLIVDRYYLSNGTKQAIVDLGTPRGVDNVDAYRLMIESFTWK